jgi:hypothetical protein
MRVCLGCLSTICFWLLIKAVRFVGLVSLAELSSSIPGSAEGSRYLRERRYAPVPANVRDPLTTLNIEQLKLVSNIDRSNSQSSGDVNDNGACVERENKRN